jgi:hypothetical protein
MEVWSAPPGTLLRVAGGSDIYISPGGLEILWGDQVQSGGMLNETDRQILLGPAVVLALALRGTWCLHTSAAIFNGSLILFLGESGRGKSTLADWLAVDHPGWVLAADDIMPVILTSGGLSAWSRFPQLKMSLEAQPGPRLPEQLPIQKVCMLGNGSPEEMPGLQRLSPSQAVQALLSHTAGTRLFSPEMLSRHLGFCTLAAEKASVYRLDYPRRWDALPRILEILEDLC